MSSEPFVRKNYIQATPNSALEIPAIFSNSYTLTVNAAFARISFGENIPGDSPADARYHTSICIPMTQLKALAETILDLIQKQKIAQEASDKKKNAE